MAKLKVVFKGGPGSGFKGHRGVPGIQGGSLPDDSPSSNPKGGPTVADMTEIQGKNTPAKEPMSKAEAVAALRKESGGGFKGLREGGDAANTFNGILGSNKYVIAGQLVPVMGGYETKWTGKAGETSLGDFATAQEAYNAALKHSGTGKVEPKAVESVAKPAEISKPAETPAPAPKTSGNFVIDLKNKVASGEMKMEEVKKALGIGPMTFMNGKEDRTPDVKITIPIPGTPGYTAYVQGLVEQYNSNRGGTYSVEYRYGGRQDMPIEKDEMASFNTPEEAHLWLEEIVGQMSDGKYENTNNTQWSHYSALPVKIDKSKPTRIIMHSDHHSMSFRDLAGLMSSDYGHDDVRAAMSWVSDKKVAEYLNSITKAVNFDKKNRGY